VHRNRDPALHPFERAREYSKAVVATKLDKIFAKPFIGALDGHVDSVYCTAAIRNRMTPFISGACDGDLRVWDLSSRSCVWSVAAHTGFVRGIAPDQTGNTFYTCGDDKVVKQWALTQSVSKDETIEPLNVYNTDQPLNAIDHHWVDSQFATAGESVCLWESSRSDPLHTYKWGADAVISVAFNPAESCLLGSTGSDRSVCLYDLRASVPMRKFVLSMKSNKLAWNPREPFNFALANEDNNIYTFDMRNLNKALMVHKDHVSAVLDVAFSPTGREFVTGSYDRTIRIFAIDGPRSREVYHTKRMQRVFSVNFSADSRFVLSGSDDTNIRIWKTNAAKSMGVVPGRQERKEQLHDALKRRYAHMPEVKRIAKHKREPKSIRKAAALTQIQRDSERKKNDNRKRHAREGEYSIEPERKRAVLREYE
jgi:DDB1- and CUL4-associated factor 13